MLFVFFLFGDDGFEFDRREGPTIGERAPVTCYQGLKSSSSSFRVKFLLSSTRFCGDDCCVLDGSKEQWCESSGVTVIVRAGLFSEL